MEELLQKLNIAACERLCVILRGIPGSGKTTVADKLVLAATEAGKTVQVCCADDYMVNKDGEYSFDASRLADAHGKCYAKFQQSLQNLTDVIIVANTNCTRQEYAR